MCCMERVGEVGEPQPGSTGRDLTAVIDTEQGVRGDGVRRQRGRDIGLKRSCSSAEFVQSDGMLLAQRIRLELEGE